MSSATRSVRQVETRRQSCIAPCEDKSCCATTLRGHNKQRKRTIPLQDMPILPPVAPVAELGALVTVFLLHTLLNASNTSDERPWSLEGEDAPIRVLMHAYSQRHIALRSFFNHIVKHTGSSTHLLLAAKYVQRLCIAASGGTKRFESDSPTGLKLTPRALLLACLLIAAKQLDDGTPRGANKVWAGVGGMGAEELGAAERECLAALGWELLVSKEEFEEWTMQVERVGETARQKMEEKSLGLKRWKKSYPEEGCEGDVEIVGYGSSGMWSHVPMKEVEV